MRKRQEETDYYRRLFGRLFIFTGSFLMAAAAAVNVMDYVKSRSAVTEFEKTKKEIITIVDTEDAVSVQPDMTAPDTGTDEIDLKTVLGVLRIPKIELEEAVREGTNSSVISSALGHVTHTALPGEQGNCAIAGHRNYVFGRYFNRLDEMEPGDTIEIETLEGTYTYTVTESFVVEPKEVSVLDTMEGYNLTLITCTPLFIGSHRLIIRAALNDAPLN